jgi:hypothetical protein
MIDDGLAFAVLAVEQHHEIDRFAAGQGRDLWSFDNRSHATFFQEIQDMPQRACKALAAHRRSLALQCPGFENAWPKQRPVRRDPSRRSEEPDPGPKVEAAA